MFTKIKNKISVAKNNLKNVFGDLKTRKYINIYTIVIFIFSIFVFSPLFFGYINGDDYAFHVANINARSSDFSYVFAKILPEIGHNLGYGIGLFYPCLPHVLASSILSIVSLFGFDFLLALKITKFLIILCSGLTMYLLATKLFKNKQKGVMSAIFYLSSSYFFVDMYSRDALNECFVFIFMPLVFLGLYYLFRENNKLIFYICFILGYVGLMYSHLVLAVWFTLFLIIFLLLFLKEIFKKQNLVPLIIASMLILIFTSPFTISLVEHMINGEYTIFTMPGNQLHWTLSIKYFFLPFFDYTSKQNYLYVTFNIIIILLGLCALIRIFKKKVPKNRVKFIIGFLIIGILGMFFTSCDTIWPYIPEFLYNIQFPWRTATFATIGICILAVEGLDSFYQLFKKKYIPVASTILIIILSANVCYNMLHIQMLKSFECNINNGMGGQREYLPIETANHLEYFDNREDDKIKIIKGKANVKILKNKIPNMEFKVKNIKKTVTLELPRLYYLGYKITDSKGQEIKNFKNDNGFVAVKIKENGKYYLSYPGTTAYQIAKYICIITIVICVIILILTLRKRRS